MNKIKNFDVIVIGGGHAGIEAAHAAAKMQVKTALITLKKDKIGYMPCNPAIGGIGKGHIVFEISALGGLMPKLCTQTYLQARMLNTKKGPAVHGLRLQIDKIKYANQAQKELGKIENLTIIEAMVDDLVLDNSGAIKGVTLSDQTFIQAKTVILTTGTFLNGLVHIGKKQYASGREKEKAVTKLAASIKSLDLKMGRLKTGTPPRLLKSSINYSVMTKQDPDKLHYLFEFYPHTTNSTHDCYITHTNKQVHEVILNNADQSPMLQKDITGIGPRYCPSIEDKVTRFSEKETHQIFVEPESDLTDWVYPNGISTSLPLEVQKEWIKKIKGFEKAEIVQAGYAIEYDFVLPDQLKHTLELKKTPGLFFAGQLNGTTGYEEAAGQGMIAGINAALQVKQEPPFILNRTESYIGVMIDDLVTLGVDEPYRMFTSRAERRLLLRQDNSFLRLTPKGYQLGLIDKKMYQDFCKEKEIIESALKTLQEKYTHIELLDLFKDNTQPEKAVQKTLGVTLSSRCCQTIQAEVKYAPYIVREKKEVEKIQKYQNMKLPKDYDYSDIQGISTEIKQKLNQYQPATIAQAGLISGMTPAALSLLVLKLSRKE